MRLVRCQDKCVAKLRAGECKRAPRGVGRLFGYYVGCPACGLAQPIVVGEVSIVEEGMEVGETPRLTIAAVTCGRCGCVFEIDRDEFKVRCAG